MRSTSPVPCSFPAAPAGRGRLAWMLLLAAAIAAAAPAQPGQASPAPPEDRPTLAVLLVLDGLRGDLLDRHQALFTGGFQRLRHDGLCFTQAFVDHAITVSHAGHVTLATGLHPSHHGIVDAAYSALPPASTEGTRRLTDAVADSTEQIVGVPGARGASPRQVLAPGLAEWFRAHDPHARAAAFGSGQYASLLHVFSAGADVYWFVPSAGRYATSSFYRADDPEWVARFNAKELPRVAEQAADWQPSSELTGVDLGRPDAYAPEADGVHTAFPHRFREEVPPAYQADPARWYWLANTPFLDLATLRLAQEAVGALQLGQRQSTDYLTIVLSQTDGLGHWYGPLSHESTDALVRLDRWLDDFFGFLDRRVGAGRWVAALTADHGMPDLPEHDAAQGHSAVRIAQARIDSLQAEVAQLLSSGRSDQIAAAIAARDFVAAVYAAAALAPALQASACAPDVAPAAGSVDDPFVRLYRNSFRSDRIPRLPLFRFADGTSSIADAGFMVRLREGAMIDLDRAVHGSPYGIDRHVPLMFLGAGVPRGVVDRPARTVDVAPTLAHLARVPAPPGLDGVVLVP